MISVKERGRTHTHTHEVAEGCGTRWSERIAILYHISCHAFRLAMSFQASQELSHCDFGWKMVVTRDVVYEELRESISGGLNFKSISRQLLPVVLSATDLHEITDTFQEHRPMICYSGSIHLIHCKTCHSKPSSYPPYTLWCSSLRALRL